MKKRELLAAVLAGTMLAGCTGGAEKEILRETNPASQESSAAATTAAPETQAAVLPETVIYQEEGITVTATGLEDSLFGPTVRIMASNETDKNIAITTQSLSVNGYMLSSSGLYCSVAAGKRANGELTLMQSELDQAGIETIGEVQFYLHISDSGSYEKLDESGLISVRTSASGSFDQKVDDSGQTVYDKEGIRVICKGLRQDVLWDGALVFYMENNAEEDITVCAEKISVNGFMVDTSLWTDLRENTRAIEGMYLMDLEDLNLQNIGGVETMEFSLRIIDSRNWTEIDRTGPIALDFQ